MRSSAFHGVHGLWNQIALKCECVTTLWPPGVCVSKSKGRFWSRPHPPFKRGYLCSFRPTQMSICVCVWGAAVPWFGADGASEDPWTGKKRTSSRRLHKNISLSLFSRHTHQNMTTFYAFYASILSPLLCVCERSAGCACAEVSKKHRCASNIAPKL